MKSLQPLIIYIICGHYQTALASIAPKIWLSEYGYIHDSSKYVKTVSIPASDHFKTNENFQDKFVTKVGTDYVAMENTTFMVFTCESYQPIFWTITQNLNSINSLPWTIFTVNVRSYANQSATFKSLIIIDTSPISIDDYSSLSSLYFQIQDTSSPSSTFTCQSNIIDQTVESISSASFVFRKKMETHETDPYGHLNPDTYQQYKETLKPEQKIFIAFTKTVNDGAMVAMMKNMTTLNLDNAMYHISNSVANNPHIVLESNVTINFSQEDFSKIDEDGWEQFNFNGNRTPTRLVQYKNNEDIFMGDNFQIFCFSLNMFYSFGAYVQVNWENGTSTILREINSKMKGIHVILSLDEIAKHPIFGSTDIRYFMYSDLLFYLSQPLEAKLEMKSVDCIMPTWNTGGEWEKVSRSLKILPK